MFDLEYYHSQNAVKLSSTSTKLEGATNFPIFHAELTQVLHNLHPELQEYSKNPAAFRVNDKDSATEKKDKLALLRSMRSVFRNFIVRNSTGEAFFQYGPLTLDEWITNYDKFCEQSIDERATCLFRLAELEISKNKIDREKFRMESTLLKITPLENVIVGCIAEYDLPLIKVIQILTHWAKVHNFLRTQWSSKNFEENTYGFTSNITDTFCVTSFESEHALHGSSMKAEFTAVMAFVKKVTDENLGLKIKRLDMPINSINSFSRGVDLPVNSINSSRGGVSKPNVKDRRTSTKKLICFNCMADGHTFWNCKQTRDSDRIEANKKKVFGSTSDSSQDALKLPKPVNAVKQHMNYSSKIKTERNI